MRNRAVKPIETNLNPENFSKEVASPTLPKPIRASNLKDAQRQARKNIKSEPKSKRKFKKAFVYFCTNFGTIFFSVIYALLGAYLFQVLEQHESTALCQKAQAESSDFLEEYK